MDFYRRVLDSFWIKKQEGKWKILQEEVPGGILIPSGTFLKRGFYVDERHVLSGPHKGLELWGYPEEETLGALDHSKGTVIFKRPRTFGWGGGFDVWNLLGEGFPHPSKGSNCFCLKKGETLGDFPTLAPRADQKAWLKDREVPWAPRGGWGKPRRIPAADGISQVKTLDALAQWLGVETSTFEYSSKVLAGDVTFEQWETTVSLRYKGYRDPKPVKVQFTIRHNPRAQYKNRVISQVKVQPIR